MPPPSIWLMRRVLLLAVQEGSPLAPSDCHRHLCLTDSLMAGNKQSLSVSFEHLCDVMPQPSIWLADQPRQMLEIFHKAAKDVARESFRELFENEEYMEVYVRITDLPVSDTIRDIRHHPHLPLSISNHDLISKVHGEDTPGMDTHTLRLTGTVYDSLNPPPLPISTSLTSPVSYTIRDIEHHLPLHPFQSHPSKHSACRGNSRHGLTNYDSPRHPLHRNPSHFQQETLEMILGFCCEPYGMKNFQRILESSHAPWLLVLHFPICAKRGGEFPPPPSLCKFYATFQLTQMMVTMLPAQALPPEQAALPPPPPRVPSQCIRQALLLKQFLMQTLPPEQADPHLRGGHPPHRGVPPAADGQVRLHQVRLCAGALLPEHRDGSQAQLLPPVPDQRRL